MTTIQSCKTNTIMQFSLQAWKKKRRLSMFVYLLWGITFGIDYSLIIVTQLSYLKDLVKTPKYQYYYGLIVCLYYAVASISGVIITRIVDRTRRVKLAMCICIAFAVVGNLLFTVYLSPILLLIGRALVGVNNAIDSIIVGEIIRTYEVKEGTQAQWWFIGACSIGFITGSWINLCFTSINITMPSSLSITNKTTTYINATTLIPSPPSEPITIINRHNFTGLFLSGIHLIMLLAVFFFAHDCSKEYDLKTILHEQQLSEMYVIENKRAVHQTKIVGKSSVNTAVTSSKPECRNRNTSIAPSSSFDSDTTRKQKLMTTFKGLCQQPDAAIILVSSFVFSFIAFTLDLLIPIIIQTHFDWTDKWVSINYTIHSVAYFFAILLCSKICTTNKRVFWTNISAIVFTVVTLSLLITMAELIMNRTMKIIMISAFQIAYIPVWFLDEVTQSNLLARIVQSDIQSFSEAIRSAISKTGCIAASIVIAANVDVTSLSGVLIGCSILSMMSYLHRKKKMIKLQIMIFSEK